MRVFVGLGDGDVIGVQSRILPAMADHKLILIRPKARVIADVIVKRQVWDFNLGHWGTLQDYLQEFN